MLKTKDKSKVVNAPASIQIKCKRRMVKIVLTDICYIEAQGNYLSNYTLTGRYKTYMAISDLEKQLPESLFVRVHRSFIISLSHVRTFNNAAIHVGDKQLPIGRSYS